MYFLNLMCSILNITLFHFHASVFCASFADPCLHSKYGTTYPSYFNCRTFYTCNRHQHSLPMCCNKGYSYNHQAQKCTPNPYCNVECAEREMAQTTVSPVTTTISMGSKNAFMFKLYSCIFDIVFVLVIMKMSIMNCLFIYIFQYDLFIFIIVLI